MPTGAKIHWLKPRSKNDKIVPVLGQILRATSMGDDLKTDAPGDRPEETRYCRAVPPLRRAV